MTMRAAEWDDDRLKAAFAARAAADRKAPGDLVAAVIDAVAAKPRSIAGFRRSIVAAAAAVILVVGLGGVAALTVLTRSGIAAIPSAAASELARLGLQVLTVAEAARIRDAGTDDREIAVHGWFRQLPGPPGTPGPSCHPTLRVPVNPALPQRCGDTEQRIVDEPAAAGASIRPLFGILDRTALMAAVSGNRVADVVVIGHFDDRRSVMCGADAEAECRDTFLVDRIVSVNGTVLESSTSLSLERLEPGKVQPKWTAGDVDRLSAAAAPQMTVAARLAIPGERVFEIEPALGTGSHGIVGRQLVWIVNGFEPRAGQSPRVRTFIFIDNDPTAAFVSVPYTTSNTGFSPVAIPAAEPSPSTGDPFAGAPTSVFGIGVGSLSTTLALHPQRDAAEIAIRGWYVPPDPAADCPLLRDAIRPVEIPCSQGRHWLLEEPQQLWSDPLKVDIDRQPSGPYLNPIIPFDVSFTVPSGWEDGRPEPWPVVMVGHFGDPRPRTTGGRSEFTVDALVWQRGDATPPGELLTPTVSFQTTTETEEAVRQRLDDDLRPAIATWLTVVNGTQLQIVDPDIEPGRTDVAEAPAVWVARRLVNEPDPAGVMRPVVATAMTVDGSNRIWERGGCCSFDLTTTVDVKLGDASGHAGSLRIADDLGRVSSARIDPSVAVGTWRTIGPEGFTIRVGATDDPRELAIEWPWPSCKPSFRVHMTAESWIGFTMTPFVEGSCPRPPVPTTVVLTLREPVDVRTIHTDEVLGGG